MCGIFGYIGNKNASDVLIDGLQRLEYRGYDSAGAFILNTDHSFDLTKSVGKVSSLASKIDTDNESNNSEVKLGIAHTRWATHGKPTEVNTHPHYDTQQKFFVVHNGIIENHAKLKKELQDTGYEFYSETDTEVIPALLSKNWTGNLLQTIEKTIPMLRGAYALLIAHVDFPDELIAIKRGSPLILWVNKDSQELFFSSDTQALSGYAQQMIQLQDGDLVHIKDQRYTIRAEWSKLERKLQNIDAQNIVASKGDFPTFMLKEIFEQPAIIKRIFKGRVNFDTGDLYSNSIEFLKYKDIKKIVFVGCGTSYNAGQLGVYWIEDLAEIDASAEIASEYIHKHHRIDNQTLHIFLSQSWETADSIEVLKDIKNKWGMTLGIVNTVGSTIANLTDCGFFLRAGAEIGVASTKAFTAQLSCILILSLYFGKKDALSYSYFKKIMDDFQKLPDIMQQTLELKDEIKTIAKEISEYKNMFFLGRHYQMPIADEASLKLKEISYIHSESYPAGELKHGPLALIDETCPSILFAPDDFLFEENISSLSEIQSRSGKLLVVSDQAVPEADWHIQTPKTNKVLMPFISVIVAQLLSYYVAEFLGKDIDKPRNLAKSVTVK